MAYSSILLCIVLAFGTCSCQYGGDWMAMLKGAGGAGGAGAGAGAGAGLAGLFGPNGYNPAMLSQTVNAIAAQYGGGPVNLAQYMGAFGAGQGKGLAAMGNGYAQGQMGAEY